MPSNRGNERPTCAGERVSPHHHNPPAPITRRDPAGRQTTGLRKSAPPLGRLRPKASRLVRRSQVHGRRDCRIPPSLTPRVPAFPRVRSDQWASRPKRCASLLPWLRPKADRPQPQRRQQEFCRTALNVASNAIHDVRWIRKLSIGPACPGASQSCLVTAVSPPPPNDVAHLPPLVHPKVLRRRTSIR